MPIKISPNSLDGLHSREHGFTLKIMSPPLFLAETVEEPGQPDKITSTISPIFTILQ
jgi:hypothetical protein